MTTLRTMMNDAQKAAAKLVLAALDQKDDAVMAAKMRKAEKAFRTAFRDPRVIGTKG